MSEDTFAKALRNFTMDTAAGDAIRHLCDKGFTLPQVKEALTFPAPEDYIAEVMWDRLVETRKVLPDPARVSERLATAYPARVSERLATAYPAQSVGCRPGEGPDRTHAERTEIIEHRDRYGRKSFLQVEKKESPEENTFSPEDYVQYENLLVISSALEQVSSLSDHIPQKVRNTGSHRDT